MNGVTLLAPKERGVKVAQAMYDLGLFRDPLFVKENFGVLEHHLGSW